jgi:hypothetical protein
MSIAAVKILGDMQAFLASLDDDRISRFLDGFDWELEQRPIEPMRLACLRHLPQAVTAAAPRALSLAEHLAGATDSLRWAQTYTAADFGDDFLGGYGWTEIFGTRGHFRSSEVAGGFLLLGPNLTYPDHHHVAEEIYVPLTGGTEWRMGNGDFALRDACDIIHHPSNVSHAMRTGSAPLLALYLWRGGPLDQRSDIGVRAHS